MYLCCEIHTGKTEQKRLKNGERGDKGSRTFLEQRITDMTGNSCGSYKLSVAYHVLHWYFDYYSYLQLRWFRDNPPPPTHTHLERLGYNDLF